MLDQSPLIRYGIINFKGSRIGVPANGKDFPPAVATAPAASMRAHI